MGREDLHRQLISSITVYQGYETFQRWYVAINRSLSNNVDRLWKEPKWTALKRDSTLDNNLHRQEYLQTRLA